MYPQARRPQRPLRPLGAQQGTRIGYGAQYSPYARAGPLRQRQFTPTARPQMRYSAGQGLRPTKGNTYFTPQGRVVQQNSQFGGTTMRRFPTPQQNSAPQMRPGLVQQRQGVTPQRINQAQARFVPMARPVQQPKPSPIGDFVREWTRMDINPPARKPQPNIMQKTGRFLRNRAILNAIFR